MTINVYAKNNIAVSGILHTKNTILCADSWPEAMIYMFKVFFSHTAIISVQKILIQ